MRLLNVAYSLHSRLLHFFTCLCFHFAMQEKLDTSAGWKLSASLAVFHACTVASVSYLFCSLEQIRV